MIENKDGTLPILNDDESDYRYEDNESPKAIQTVRRNIFKTKSGLKMLDSMYGDTEQ